MNPRGSLADKGIHRAPALRCHVAAIPESNSAVVEASDGGNLRKTTMRFLMLLVCVALLIAVAWATPEHVDLCAHAPSPCR